MEKKSYFTIIDLEDQNLLYTNCVYMHPSDFNTYIVETRFTQLIEFESGHVFEILCANHIPIGCLTLNVYQRKSTKLMLNDRVKIFKYNIPQNKVMNLWIKMIKGHAIHVRFSEFTKHFKETYLGQVFCNGQILVVEFQTRLFEIIVYANDRTTLDESAEVKCMFDISNSLLSIDLNENENNCDCDSMIETTPQHGKLFAIEESED